MRHAPTAGYYVSYVQIWQALGPSVHKTIPSALGQGNAKVGAQYSESCGDSDPMREAGAPST